MLSIDQYKTLAGLIPAVNEELRKKGVDVDGKEVEDSDSGSDEKPAKSSKKPTKNKSASKKRANIEATSDEDED